MAARKGRAPCRAEGRALLFLRRGPLELRRDGWRFGTARVPDVAVERLVAAGRVRRLADSIVLLDRSR